ncbi:HAD family hydrolase [Nonomuraea jiangxiensis]|uniref:Phosphoglycolate phosphatase/pyrophosphatase PpaX/AHBA synthesis associated protein n=1 Tax=Nonomuraea jiangxiensis TaxID=633440 RepID=A0A1G8MJ47_9ACTN|nr:phosphoglycolate phosphatase/pyrophosphatase PpaX/AHBA synthesis associated protein [Nonomuraea jiangxiensis]
MTVRAVVFDLDGTLVDTMTSIPYAYVRTIRDLGGPDVSPALLIASWHIGPTPAVLAHFLGRTVTATDLKRFHAHIATAAESTRPFPGIPELLRRLRHDGMPLALYTSATRHLAGLMLARTGLTGYFPVVVTGDEVTNPKPAPDGLLETCRLLGVPASATAYVGDSDTDLRCARAAGALPIHARWSPHLDDLPAHPHAAHRPTDVLTITAAQGDPADAARADEPRHEPRPARWPSPPPRRTPAPPDRNAAG